MHKKIARTSNVKAFYASFGKLEERGSREASWLMVTGDPGLGKTLTVHRFAAQKPAIFVRAKSNWTPGWMLREIAETLGVDATGSTETLFGRVLGAFVASGAPLVVDEARNTLHDAKLLETIRDLSDAGDVLVVLSGEEFVLRRLETKHPQIRSRITEVVRFMPATLEDVRLFCDDIAEVKIADDLAVEILRQSRGYLREIKNAVAAIERWAALQGLKLVDASHVAGRALCQDRSGARRAGGAL